ncbi:MAG: hypothetical protein K5985_08165 [Lachnospiraceae bacterium]|nr:hypothetical protein [Lachnospiraceae bacterium]
MKTKTWLISWAVITIIALGTAAGLTFVIDPFFHYHAPESGKFFYTLDNQRSQNDGIVRHFDYNGIITGTSMTDNFLASEAEEFFGGSFIKIPSDGASFKEINDYVAKAALRGKLKTVIRCLDMGGFWEDKDLMREDMGTFPYYLYDENPFNDIEYLLNKDVFFGKLCRMLSGRFRKDFFPGITSFDDYSSWRSGYTYGFEAVCPGGISTEKTGENTPLTDELKERMRENIYQNVIKTTEENPDVDFYYFYSPYSIVYWNDLNNKGMLLKQLEAESFVTDLLLPCENIHLFSFNTKLDLVADLDNYKDSLHYGPWVNSDILRWLKAGEYQLTKDNAENYLKEEYEIFTAYDYSGIGM